MGAEGSHRHIHSPDEIELLIAESRDGGLLEPDEHRRLQRALRLNLRQAKQLMVPRRKIAALSIDTPLHEVIGIVAQSPFSRLPVYRDSLDNIVGILHTKEPVRWFVSEDPRPRWPIPSRRAVGSRGVTADRTFARVAGTAVPSGPRRRRGRRHIGPADVKDVLGTARTRGRRVRRLIPRPNRLPAAEHGCRGR
jgi:CBS domain-containing protein